jgi:hypothetical protein
MVNVEGSDGPRPDNPAFTAKGGVFARLFLSSHCSLAGYVPRTFFTDHTGKVIDSFHSGNDQYPNFYYLRSQLVGEMRKAIDLAKPQVEKTEI